MTGARREGPGYREHRPAPDLAPWLGGRGTQTLASVALDAGYYDQAHMNADFRDLAGCPPLSLAE